MQLKMCKSTIRTIPGINYIPERPDEAGTPVQKSNLRTEIENFHKIFWSMQLVELNKSTYQYGFIDIKSEEKGKIFCFKILTATKIKIYLR